MTPAEQKQQLKLANMVREKTNLANKLLEDSLKISFFPIEATSKSWRKVMMRATEHAQPMACNFPLKEFADLQMFGESGYEKLTLHSFRGLNNCVEVVSRTELGLSRTSYAKFIDEALIHIKTYAGLVKALKDEIDIQVEKEYSKKVEVAGGREAILKTITGEA